jgi:hypothetical protein
LGNGVFAGAVCAEAKTENSRLNEKRMRMMKDCEIIAQKHGAQILRFAQDEPTLLSSG